MSSSTKEFFSTKQAAVWLGFSAGTLKLSRHTGELAGVPCPSYFKVGRNARYRLSDLEAWVSQFNKVNRGVKS